MIKMDNVSFSYRGGDRAGGVEGIDLEIPTGQVVVLCGESGCGKTTLTRLVNGLAPEYYEGELAGAVSIDGTVVSKTPLPIVSRKVGSVFQNPRSQFFNVGTTDEIAFGCENQGLPAEEIYRRIGHAADEIGVRPLLDRSLFALSGGEKQKIACASVSAMEPDVFVLDEPSSNLDISTIADLKETVRAWKRAGKTVVVAEHRLYWLMDVADRVVYLRDGRIAEDWAVEEFRRLPDGELAARGLRSLHPASFAGRALPPKVGGEGPRLVVEGLSFGYGRDPAIDIERLNLPVGEVVGVLGPNGAGKTTFARCLCGLEKRAKGKIALGGSQHPLSCATGKGYLVMQDVSHQLFTESVLDEVLLSFPGDDAPRDRERVAELLGKLGLEGLAGAHPMSLSAGQRQRVAIASAKASGKDLVVFDEPTSGLDFVRMGEVAECLAGLASEGKAVLVITHDPELVFRCCSFFVFLEGGGVKWTGGWSDGATERLARFFSSAT